MILVVVAESIVKVHISFEIFSQVEGQAANAFIHGALFNVVRTSDVFTLFHAGCVIYYVFFDLKERHNYKIIQ